MVDIELIWLYLNLKSSVVIATVLNFRLLYYIILHYRYFCILFPRTACGYKLTRMCTNH